MMFNRKYSEAFYDRLFATQSRLNIISVGRELDCFLLCPIKKKTKQSSLKKNYWKEWSRLYPKFIDRQGVMATVSAVDTAVPPKAAFVLHNS